MCGGWAGELIHNPGKAIGNLGTDIYHSPVARDAAIAAAAYYGGPAAWDALTTAGAGTAAAGTAAATAGAGAATATDFGAGAALGAGADSAYGLGAMSTASPTFASLGAGTAGAGAGAGLGSQAMSALSGAGTAVGNGMSALSPYVPSLGTVGTGLGIMEMLNANKMMNPPLNPQLMGQAQAPNQAATTGFQQYSSGQLAPSDALHIAQWQQSQQQSIKNYYAQAGLGSSSMMQQSLEQVGVQANSMRDQARQGYLQQALASINAAGTPVSQAVYTQLSQNQAAQTALQNYMYSMGNMLRTPGGP